MGFYSIYKIFKDIFRTIFGNKALKLIFIILIFVLIIMFFNNKGVFAESQYSLNTSFFTENDIAIARQKVGEEIWNNENYDIFLTYRRDWNSKAVEYFDITPLVNAYPDTNIVYMLESNVNNNILAFNASNFDTKSTLLSTTSNQFYMSELCLTNNNKNMNVNSRNIYVLNYFSNNSISYCAIRSHFDLYDRVGNKLADKTIPTDPFIETESSTINNWSFDYLHINSGSQTIYYNNVLGEQTTATLYLDYIYNGIRYRYNIPNNLYAINTNDTFDIYIPRTSLLNNVNITNGFNVSFYLGIRKNTEDIFPLGDYTFALTTEEQEQIQQDSDKALQGEILGAQQETNNKLDNLDNTINDSSVEDITSDTLPSDSTNDITADGVNGIFTSIYNAFCTGQAQDIVFPIPFTDKSITLSPSYISDALINSGATFIITIIQAFWWYLISRFIIKDVMNKINKIKSGNIEDIETNNIRGDML